MLFSKSDNLYKLSTRISKNIFYDKVFPYQILVFTQKFGEKFFTENKNLDFFIKEASKHGKIRIFLHKMYIMCRIVVFRLPQIQKFVAELRKSVYCTVEQRLSNSVSFETQLTSDIDVINF